MYLFDLKGKVAVVTGGSRGIGMMMARGLLQAGASVYISSRKPEAGDAAAAELSQYGTVLSIPADLSREEECQRLAEEVSRSEEGVNVLVNNAGTNWAAPLEDFPAHGWDKVVDLNLKTPFYLTRAFLPLLEAAGTADDPARVINVGSIDGLRVPELNTYSYAASKAGLHQLTRVLARELGPRHITVNAVAPGPFASRMMAATLAAAADRSPPPPRSAVAAAINTGDLVEDGQIPQHWERFLRLTQPLFSRVPYFAVAGNHERTDTENGVANWRTATGATRRVFEYRGSSRNRRASS